MIKKKKQGIILIYAIIIGSLLLLITLSIVTLVVAEVRFAGRIDDSTRAFYAAESGAEYALRWVLRGGTAGIPGQPQDCRDETGMARESQDISSGMLVEWHDLDISLQTSPPPASQPFLRIQVTGVSNEISRSLAIDFTPRCAFTGTNWND